jgi:ectoine hydroxylase-related dioxygenase (phytanoyl-CoA dioxygenase family)
MAPKLTYIHLNGRASSRFMDYIDKTYPQLEKKWHCFTDYSVLVVPGEYADDKLQAIITDIKNRYPIEIETVIEPANASANVNTKAK